MAEVAAASQAHSALARFDPAKAKPHARDVYRDLVNRLTDIDDISTAREALRQLLGGEVRIVPTDGALYAETTNAGLAGVCE